MHGINNIKKSKAAIFEPWQFTGDLAISNTVGSACAFRAEGAAANDVPSCSVVSIVYAKR